MGEGSRGSVVGVSCRRPRGALATLLVALALVGAVTIISACSPGEAREVRLDGIRVNVDIADDETERSLGLQEHEPLDPGEGMLFVFEEPAPRTFAMKDVAFPIDVLFFDESLQVSAIEPLDPGDTRLVTSPGPSPYVLELPQGWAAEQGIGIGSVLEIVE